jgi:hypothetical protein
VRWAAQIRQSVRAVQGTANCEVRLWWAFKKIGSGNLYNRWVRGHGTTCLFLG